MSIIQYLIIVTLDKSLSLIILIAAVIIDCVVIQHILKITVENEEKGSSVTYTEISDTLAKSK